MSQSHDSMETGLIETLANEYESMFYVDLFNGRMSIYRMDNRAYERSRPAATDVLFSDYIELMVLANVSPEFQKEVLDFTDLAGLRERLSGCKSVSTRYRTKGAPPRYKEMRIVKTGFSDCPENAVVTILDQTELAVRELESIEMRHELELARARRDREAELIAAKETAENARRELAEISAANSMSLERALLALQGDVGSTGTRPFLEIVRERFNADVCFLSRLDVAHGANVIEDLHMVARDGRAVINGKVSAPIGLFSSHRAQLLSQGLREWNARDLAEIRDAYGISRRKGAGNASSMTSVPLFVKGAAWGVLNVVFDEDRRLNELEKGNFRRLASVFGSAIERRLNYEELSGLHAAAAEESIFINRIFNASPSPCFLKDADYGLRYVRCNAAYAALVGARMDEIIGKTAEELLGPGISALAAKRDEEALGGAAAIQYEDTMVFEDGSSRTLRCWKQTLMGSGHRLVLCVIHDVTEERRAAAAESFKADVSSFVVAHRDQWQIIDYVARRLIGYFNCDHVIFAGVDGYRRDWFLDDVREGVCNGCANCPMNSADSALFGSSNMVNLSDARSPDALQLPPDCPNKSVMATQVMVDGKPWARLGVIYARRRSPFFESGERVMRIAVDFIALSVQRANAMAEISRKNQEILQALDDAKKAERTKSTFLATMSHEIRTPLNAVIGFSEFLRDAGCSPEERDTYLDGITKSSNALLALINDILDLSKLEARNIEVRGGICDMRKLFEEMASIFQFSAQDKHISLDYEIDKDFPLLDLREERVRQILLNLVGNAVKFTQKGGVNFSAGLDCVADDGTATLVVKVADTGIGISPDKIQAVFDPFMQDGGIRGGKVYKGTGLGLPISRRLAEAAGGTLVAESKLGAGSVFTLSLPGVGLPETECAPLSARECAPDAPATQPRRREASSADIAKLRFVLVDDVQMNLRILRQYLKRLGVPVDGIEMFGGAREAMAYLKSAEASRRDGRLIVLTDMWMPGMNGEALAREMRADPELAGVPVVAVTADADAGSTFDVDLFDSILTKPVTGDSILNLLGEFCPGGDGARKV